MMDTALINHRPLSKNKLISSWLLLTLITILIYNLIWFNRFLPLTEGWFSTYAQLILSGKLPYRDFYLFLPPLYPLTIAGIMAIFGPQLIVLRIVGIGLILVMSGTLYALLARFFSQRIAAAVTAVTIIYYQSGAAHISYDFTQFVSTYSLLSVYFFIQYYDRCRLTTLLDSSWTKHTGHLLLSGVFGALTLWTKQSNGSFILCFIVLGIILVTLPVSRQWMLKTVIGFHIGVALISIPLLSWLAWHGLLSDFYQQIVTGAIQAKGSLSQVLFAWVKELFSKQYFHQLWHLLIGLLTLGYWRLLLGMQREPIVRDWKKEWYYLPFFMALILTLFVPIFLPALINKLQIIALKASHNLFVLASITPLLLLIQYILGPRQSSPEIMLSILALGFIFGCGTSPSISENGAFMGFALFLCHVLSSKSFFQLGRVAFLTLSLILVIFFAEKKYTTPYAWWYLQTPGIQEANSFVDLPRLKGLHLPTSTISILETVDRIVQNNSSPGDEILAFPHMPLFYLVENRLNNIRAIVHWPDFLPDSIAHQEATRIQNHPPKIIIYAELPEVVWTMHEHLFRHNQQSGQRDIISTIHHLTHTQYSIQANIPVSKEVSLYVWVKNQEKI